MADNDLVFVELSDEGMQLAAALQEVIARFDLDAHQATMAVGETFGWVHVLGFMPLGKEKVLEQMDRSSATSRKWAEDNFDGFKARLETWKALMAGESGGRLQ